MSEIKLAALLQTYNELNNGNLARYMDSVSRYCDAVCIYDDGSTDDTRSFIFDTWDAWTKGLNPQVGYGKNLKLKEIYYIDGGQNNFKEELSHKQKMLDKCKQHGVDWVLRIDADETLDERAIKLAEAGKLIHPEDKSYAFHTINLWRSPCYYRIDNGYNDVIFNRLWKLTPDLHFNVETGLHLTNYPVGATDGEQILPYEIIHWGFASNKALVDKYAMYKSHGQDGWALNRLIDESTLRLGKSKQEWFSKPLPNDEFYEVFASPIEMLVPNE